MHRACPTTSKLRYNYSDIGLLPITTVESDSVTEHCAVTGTVHRVGDKLLDGQIPYFLWNGVWAHKTGTHPTLH